MTTIAYFQGIIAYDSRCIAGGSIVDHEYNKRIDIDGVKFFVTGTVADIERACMAYFTDETFDTDVHYIAVDDGKVFLVHMNEERIYKTPESEKSVFAIGSGADHALTAMDCGLSAKEAIKKAAYRDTGTGGRVRTFRVK